jgi:vacuolar-type H+-ATPase subunit I/STV1
VSAGAQEKIKTFALESSNMNSLQELHERLQGLEGEMKEHTDKYTQLVKQRTELEENLHVLNKASKWFGQANRSGVDFTAPSSEDGRTEMATLLEDGGEAGGAGRKQLSMLGHITGCIPTANIGDFKMTLFRATRGNMHLQHEELDSRDLPDGSELKSVFIVYYSGERSKQKIDKICDSYGATKYMVQESASLRDRDESDLKDRLKDLEIVIRSTKDYRYTKLKSIANAIDLWESHVQREKAVFHTLNLFNYDVTNKCLIAEGWCPTIMLPEVREALRRGTAKSGASVQSVINIVKTKEMPPTYFQTNKLTKGFQNIVDAYGCAKYQEMNPAVFTVITFPFLFGVMFGDIGHGFMMTMAAALLCMFEGKLSKYADDEMFGTLYHGRYCILLMGVFAIYSGFIYNELFSVPLEVFQSTLWCSGEMDDPECAAIPGTDPRQMQKWPRTNILQAYDFKGDGGSTGEEVVWDNYPFGADPGWSHTANKLNTANSFKMKFAIVVGVAQMVMGVCCKLMNTLYWKDMITLYFVYIPEIVFINSIFGYLVILILIKWTTNWDTNFILNNYEIVRIPQIYCKDDLSNVPCWTAPFVADRSLVPGYGASKLAELPEYQWCMKEAPTAGCAVYEWKGKLIVEASVYGNTTFTNPNHYNPGACEASTGGCMLWKQSPPSLLDSLIKMFMEPGYVPIENQLIGGQGPLQAFLILIAFVSVPMLLLPKPFLLKREHEAKQAARGGFQPLQSFAQEDEEAGGDHGHGHGHGHGEEFEFGEVMVHQMIHTIEYVLGCISNTASYLRLWALSLAHAQLSEVFWEKTVIEVGLESSSPMMLFITIGASLVEVVVREGYLSAVCAALGRPLSPCPRLAPALSRRGRALSCLGCESGGGKMPFADLTRVALSSRARLQGHGPCSPSGFSWGWSRYQRSCTRSVCTGWSS